MLVSEPDLYFFRDSLRRTCSMQPLYKLGVGSFCVKNRALNFFLGLAYKFVCVQLFGFCMGSFWRSK